MAHSALLRDPDPPGRADHARRAPDQDRAPDHDGGRGVGRVLWLVRHGESTWNALGLAQGQSDQAYLTRRGVRQAWVVAGRLCDRPICAVYTSDLRRAAATAAPLTSVLGLSAAPDARLRERCLGALEGAASAAIRPAVNGLRSERVRDPDARPPGGESLRDLYRRVAGFADDLAGLSPPGEVAVVAHGGTIRVLSAYLCSVPVEGMRWGPLANGSILRIAAAPAPTGHETMREELR